MDEGPSVGLTTGKAREPLLPQDDDLGSVIAEFAEAPDQLWASSGRTDRVAAAFLERYPPAQSLYLVHIPNATIVRDTKSGYRLRFCYHGIDYALKITDPTLSSQFGFALYEAEGVPLEDIHVCLSLGGKFHGFHY